MALVESKEWEAFVEELRPHGGGGFGWQGLFGEPASVLFDIEWVGNAPRAKLEAFPGVIALGFPWEPLPAEAVPILAAHVTGAAAYAQGQQAQIDGAPAALPMLDATDPSVPQVSDSVARGIAKIGRNFF